MTHPELLLFAFTGWLLLIIFGACWWMIFHPESFIHNFIPHYKPKADFRNFTHYRKGQAPAHYRLEDPL